MNVGEKINYLRNLRNMSAEQLAAKVGVNRATIYRYENGDTENISFRSLKSLCWALKVPMSYFSSEEQTDEDPTILYYEELVDQIEGLLEASNYEYDYDAHANITIYARGTKQVLYCDDQYKLADRYERLLESGGDVTAELLLSEVCVYTPEVLEVAEAYVKADQKTKSLVRVALDLEIKK